MKDGERQAAEAPVIVQHNGEAGEHSVSDGSDGFFGYLKTHAHLTGSGGHYKAWRNLKAPLPSPPDPVLRLIERHRAAKERGQGGVAAEARSSARTRSSQNFI